MENNNTNNKHMNIKQTVRDSIFTNLFKNKKYLLQLYKVLHPEDTQVTEEDLTNITINNVLINAPYNDLGFRVNDKFIIMVEAQTTWSINIVLRSFIYLARTYYDYLVDKEDYIYSNVKIKVPKPEIFVVYTGNRGEKSDIISLSKEFFGGDSSFLDLNAKVIYLEGSNSIIDQYILFCQIYKDYYDSYGGDRKLALETAINICESRDILKEYLISKRKELISMNFDLFPEEQQREFYEKQLKRQYREEGLAEGRAEGRAEGEAIGRTAGLAEGRSEATSAVARNMLTEGVDLDLISRVTNLSIEEIKALA